MEPWEQDIIRNGIRQPLLVTQDGIILNGWRRYILAKRLGLKRVPVVIIQATVEEVELDTLIPPYYSELP